MNLGLLPPLGGGLKTTAATGQVDRLLNYYLRQYVDAFDQIYYFSYHKEALSDYTSDEKLLNRVTLIPSLRNTNYRLYALQLPQLARTQFEACQVFRVFQAVGAIPAMLAKIRYGIPFVTTYGYKYHRFSKIEGHATTALLLRFLEPLTVRMATAVIVTTSELHDYVSRFTSSHKVHLIPNGVDTTVFAPGLETAVVNPPTILFIGRLNPQKNLHRLLEAISKMDMPVQLKIIGDGPLRDELEKQAISSGIHAHFVGTIPYQDIPNHLQQATLFVLPSLIEGHPKALIEAMSCSLPCVASACEGNRLLIEHGETGMLFEPQDANALMHQLTQIITNPERARRLGQAARQHTIDHYDIRQLLTAEISLLKNVARVK